MANICFTILALKTWPENIADFVEFSLFSAQILGFSADFQRKSLDIVKQHPDNAGIWADSVF